MIQKINSTILFIFLLSCGSIYLFLFGGEFVVLAMLFLASFSLILQKSYEKELLKSFFLSTGLIITIIITNWVFTGFNISYVEYPKYILRGIVVNISMLALYNFKKIDYKDIEMLFRFIVLHASLNFFLGFILKPLLFTVSSAEGFKASTFAYIFFYMAKVDVLGLEFYRNQSIFWEPGVLGFVLNIYLFILLFGKNTGSQFKKYLIPLICFLILTTFSTTGLGLMVIQFIINFLKGRITAKKIFLSIFYLLLILPIFLSNLEDKKSGSGEKSYLARYYDTFIALDITYNNPLFGVGLSASRYNMEQTKYPRFFESDLEEGKPSTNSILSTFATLGIPISLLILLGLYKQQIIPFNRRIIFGIFLILLASEPLMLSSFFILFICSSFYSKEKNESLIIPNSTLISNE